MDYRYSNGRADLDSIEELNYISTIEEDAVIDADIEQLREWGFGSITHAHDLHLLFWELTRRGIILDKLFRVAVVECIEEEPLYTKFLGMAKRYNGWAQRQKDIKAQTEKDMKKELAEKESVIEMVRKNYRDAMDRIGRLNNEIAALKLKAKPQSEGAQVSALRHEIKKEYSQKLSEERRKVKPVKIVGRDLIRELQNTESRFFRSFNLTKEEDVMEYIEWFRKGDRKINTETQRGIIDYYASKDLRHFNKLMAAYNEEWAARHCGEHEEDNE